MENIKINTILAISGSLRADSSNTSILREMVALSSAQMTINIYDGLVNFPHFSPELDEELSPEPVNHFRHALREADGIIICTPEYAYGIPGVLKNALDWTVSSGEFYRKPVVSISASPSFTGGDKALASLLLILSALGTIDVASLSIPSVNKKLDEHKKVVDSATISNLKAILNSLLIAIQTTTASIK